MKIAITGNIGSGKSKVSSYLTSKGFKVFDADLIAREVVKPGEEALNSIREIFGDEVFNENGTLNRSKLGTVVFGDFRQKEKLEAILHPVIWKRLERLMRDETIVFAEVPLLYEVNWQDRFDYVIVIRADDDIRLKRILLRDGSTEIQAKAKMKAQMPQCKKEALADYVVDNSGEFSQTITQIEKILGFIGGKYEKN